MTKSWHRIVLLAGLVGCTTESDTKIILPFAAAVRARELEFLSMPSVTTVTRAEYVAEAEKDAKEETDDHRRTQNDAYGRLGFYPRTYDPRGSAGEASAYYGAFYSSLTKAITIIDRAGQSLLVHELTHALQDQHFDLTRLKGLPMSSDEAMALRGLIEGDAVLAQDRIELWGRGDDPATLVAQFVTSETSREASEKTLTEAKLPLIFVALPSFAYSYGAAYVAKLLDVQRGNWAYAGVNKLFAGTGPASTQEILRAGVDVDPIVPTGFGTLPAAVTAEYAVETVDRMGEWYTYLLFRPVTEPGRLQSFTQEWDGDQLLLLRKKDGASPPSTTGPSGIVWTSVWDTERAATFIETALRRLHGAVATEAEPRAFTAADGEAMWIERRENQVCLVKNFDAATMELLARVALSTKEERRMEIVRVVATTPIVH